jgi:hypothetical protein
MHVPMEKSHLKSHKCFIFFNDFNIIIFSTWLDLIGLFFCWPYFVSFGSFKRYVGITFVGKKRHFSFLFGFPLGV